MGLESEINQLDSTKKIWDRIWGKFIKSQAIIAPSAKLIQQLTLYLPRGKTILDLGCGEGRNTIYLSRIGYNVIGVDISKKAITAVESNVFEEQVDAIALVGDARYLPFKSEVFDGILAHHVFDHMNGDSFLRAFHETARVLKNEGYLLITLGDFSSILKKNEVHILEDGSLLWTKGPYKGVIVRSYDKIPIMEVIEKFPSWNVIKNELTPRGSKILLLQKMKTPHKY